VDNPVDVHRDFFSTHPNSADWGQTVSGKKRGFPTGVKRNLLNEVDSDAREKREANCWGLTGQGQRKDKDEGCD
jgi:hypothetical protein